MTRPLRRGACPGLLRPLPTGDGLLVRLACRGAISPSNFIALCTAAGARGNGIVEITSRGSVQVRGLTSQSVPLFAADVATLDVAEDGGIAVIADTLVDDREAIIDAN